MASNLISAADASKSVFSCAAFVAENIRSADGHAEAVKAVIPFFLANDDVDLAAEMANSVDDPFTRDRLLTAVAERCALIDDDEYAFQLVEAIEDYGIQGQAQEKIGIAKSGKGDFAGAIEIAGALEHPDNVLATTAFEAFRSGNPEVSEQALSMIRFPYSSVVALQTIAGHLISEEKPKEAVPFIERALEQTEEIDFVEEKIRAMVDAGSYFVEAGRRDRAIETFDAAKQNAIKLDNVHRDSFLAAIAAGFFRAGSIDLADPTLDLVADKTQIAATLTGFARHHWSKDEKDEALEALEESLAMLQSQHERETRDSRSKFALFGTIAGLFSAYGKTERGIEIAQSIGDENEQWAALGRIAATAAQNGEDELAKHAVESIGDESSRTGAMIGVSDALAAKGQKSDALALLADAEASADEIPQSSSRTATLTAIGGRFATLENHERARDVLTRALESVATIRDQSIQAVSLASISEVFARFSFEPSDADKRVLAALVERSES